MSRQFVQRQEKVVTRTISDETLLQIDCITKYFDISGDFLDRVKFKNRRLRIDHTHVHAINGVSFEIKQGEAVCIVGESGCGKSTVARTIMGLLKPNSGSISYRGSRIDDLTDRAMLPYRKKMQMIFQNPYASLNPRKTIAETLEEPVQFHNPKIGNREVKERVAEVMRSVGVDPSWGARFPHEFSGGQRQRISIARALTVEPEFIVADEPISALDVSIQAQVLNLMMALAT